MFNKTSILFDGSPQYGFYEHKEYRAPTDDSVKLLREMEEKAQEQILKSVRLDNNALKSVVHMYRNHLSCEIIFAVQIELNGRRLDTKITTSEWDTHDERMAKVFTGISNLISAEILNTSYAEMCRELNMFGVQL